VFTELRTAAADTVNTLTDLSRGIYPRLLTDADLLPALRAAAESCAVPATVTADPLELDRQPPEVKAALTSAASRRCRTRPSARANHVQIRVCRRDGAVTVAVSDDGVGIPAYASRSGTGLANMHDRVESLGGTLTVTSRPGDGTDIAAHIPSDQPPVAIAHTAARRSGPNADLAT
jgi:signal transduction histidine kinase